MKQEIYIRKIGKIVKQVFLFILIFIYYRNAFKDKKLKTLK